MEIRVYRFFWFLRAQRLIPETILSVEEWFRMEKFIGKVSRLRRNKFEDKNGIEAFHK